MPSTGRGPAVQAPDQEPGPVGRLVRHDRRRSERRSRARTTLRSPSRSGSTRVSVADAHGPPAVRDDRYRVRVPGGAWWARTPRPLTAFKQRALQGGAQVPRNGRRVSARAPGRGPHRSSARSRWTGRSRSANERHPRLGARLGVGAQRAQSPRRPAAGRRRLRVEDVTSPTAGSRRCEGSRSSSASEFVADHRPLGVGEEHAAQPHREPRPARRGRRSPWLGARSPSPRQAMEFRRHMVGFVFQDNPLLPYLSAQGNIETALLGAGMGRRERHERSAELLDEVGLADRAGSPARRAIRGPATGRGPGPGARR